jgi:hypothetical protein
MKYQLEENTGRSLKDLNPNTERIFNFKRRWEMDQYKGVWGEEFNIHSTKMCCINEYVIRFWKNSKFIWHMAP